MTTKHDMVLCGKLYPAGTLVEVLSWDDPSVLAVFPDMKKISISKFVAVKFPDRDHATIGLSKSFTHYGERFTSAKSRK